MNAEDEHGNTPLISVSGDQRPHIAELLLAQGADATARNDFGITPLHGAAGAGASATVTLLLEHGADASAPDHTLQTPLHRAVAPFLRSPSPDTVALLLDVGADINAADQAGDTPLHLAAKGSESWHQPPTVETVRLLLDRGADVTAPNNDGGTACDVTHPDDESLRALLCPYPVTTKGPTPSPDVVQGSIPSSQASDRETLLQARDTLAGSAALNWSDEVPIGQWDGVKIAGLEGSRVPD